MTQIDFYVSQESSLDAQHAIACRLTEKALRQGHRVLLATRNAEHSRQLNELLWSFRPEAFVPHAMDGEAAGEQAPVLITHEGDHPHHDDVLINLREETPEQFSRFQRLVEIVIQESAALTQSRQRYKFYASRGYPIRKHEL